MCDLFYQMLCHLEGERPYLGDLLTMVINHLLNGMIPQKFNELIPKLAIFVKPESPVFQFSGADKK